MSATNIEWTDLTVNPVLAKIEGAAAVGGYNSGRGHYCEKISEGCKHCYSSAMQPRFGLPVFQEARAAKKRGEIEVYFEPSRMLEVLRRKKPARVFWCDMTDMFGDWVPFEWVAAMFGVMAATPQHTHQVLTKRPARALAFFRWLDEEATQNPNAIGTRLGRCLTAEAAASGRPANVSEAMRQRLMRDEWPLQNVHLGVSCENQETADERIPQLLQCPAAVRFVSAEPLLGPIDLSLHFGALKATALAFFDSSAWHRALHWVIVGGESGPGARPCDLAWIRSVVAQCKAAEVPCFVKQVGAVPVVVESEWRAQSPSPLLSAAGCKRAPAGTVALAMGDAKGGNMDWWPADLRVRQQPEARS